VRVNKLDRDQRPAGSRASHHPETLTDLGYEGEANTVAVAFKKPKNANSPASSRRSTTPTTGYAPSENAATAYSRSPSRPCATSAWTPWRIGDIVAAALTVLHTEHDRTT
jgi:hypothetical protein